MVILCFQFESLRNVKIEHKYRNPNCNKFLTKPSLVFNYLSVA